MSTHRSDTSSKRKRTTPQKLKSRKIFAISENDLIENLLPGPRKVGRGRPRKLPLTGDGETSKRGRGRPKGSLKKIPSKIKSSLFSKTREEENQESQLCLSQFPETLHNRENVPKSLHQSLAKKESPTETPQNKENMPGKYSSPTGSTHRGRGRPKGSKNKTFPVSPTRVYSVREGKSPPVYSPKKDEDTKQQNGVTPHRGRGRPKGSTKVKLISEGIPKRSRGRPKGSKNKKPSKAALMKLIPGPPKMGRGRPRKLPLTGDEETPKRGRGRPKGSLNKIPSAKKPVLSSGTHEKRKRGRPKKIVLHPTVLMPLTPKRPRGRPKSTARKLPPVSRNLLKLSGYYTHMKEEDDDDDDKEEDDDDEDEDSDE